MHQRASDEQQSDLVCTAAFTSQLTGLQGRGMSAEKGVYQNADGAKRRCTDVCLKSFSCARTSWQRSADVCPAQWSLQVSTALQLCAAAASRCRSKPVAQPASERWGLRMFSWTAQTDGSSGGPSIAKAQKQSWLCKQALTSATAPRHSSGAATLISPCLHCQVHYAGQFSLKCCQARGCNRT